MKLHEEFLSFQSFYNIIFIICLLSCEQLNGAPWVFVALENDLSVPTTKAMHGRFPVQKSLDVNASTIRVMSNNLI